jgi:hypothetical protein
MRGWLRYQASYLGDDIFIVLVDQRAFYYLLTLCLRIQSLPPLARTLGLTPVPVEKNYRGKYLLDIVKDIVFHTEDVSSLIQQNPSRLVYQAANTFIIGHEVAHVSHGHLDFLASNDFASFSTSECDKNLTLSTLEMDADSSATSSVFDLFEQLVDRNIEAGRVQADISPNEYRVGTQKQYILGMYSALLYMDALSSNFFPVGHPIGYARFLTTSRVAEIVFASRFPESLYIPEFIRHQLVESFISLSGDISTLGHPIASNVMIIEDDPETPRYEYHEIGVAAGLSHLEPLYGRWSRLRPFLEKHQRGGRLAPASAAPI